MTPVPVAALAVTAQFTAAARARESERPDALFADPWAAFLAGEEGFAWLGRLGSRAALWPVVRTRFLDDLLRAIPLAQVVLPAAGFDTRAYRLPWTKETSLYELDQEGVLRRKERALRAAGAAPRCRRVAISVDLRQPWADSLLAAGFQADRPAMWIVEGLLLYLDEPAAQRLLVDISRLAAPGSCLGLDLPQHSVAGHAVADPGHWLARLGWQAEVKELPAVAASYGRWPTPLIGSSPRGRVFLISARKG